MLSPENAAALIILLLGVVVFLVDRWMLKRWVERQIDEMYRQRKEAIADKHEVRRMINANAALIDKIQVLLRRVKP